MSPRFLRIETGEGAKMIRKFYHESLRGKIGLAVNLIVLLTFIAVPCVTRAKAATTLTLWTHQRHMADLIKELIGEFNATAGKEKGIQITMRVLGDDSWNLFQDAQTRGEGPDLYSSGFITKYADPFKAEAQMCFDELPGFKEWKRQWPSWYWIEELTTHQGHVFTIPVQVFNSRLIYNRDLFRRAGLNPDNPPRSYAELREAARKISRIQPGKIYGFAYCGADAWPVEWMPSQWAEANGDAAYWDWKRGRWAMQGYNKVFQMILNLKQDGSLFPGETMLTNDALRAQFAEGRVGMFMGEFWDVGVFNSQFPTKCDWGVAPIPTYDGKFHGKPRAMIIGGLWNINGKSTHKLEAWEVVKWFSRYEVRAKTYEEGKCIDPDPLVVQKYVKKNPTVHGFEAFAGTLNQDYLATYPIMPGWKAPTQNPCTVFRQILLRGGNLEAELERLNQYWNKKLDEYYRQHPQVKRGLNIYPHFNRITGNMGAPLVKPGFSIPRGN